MIDLRNIAITLIVSVSIGMALVGLSGCTSIDLTEYKIIKVPCCIANPGSDLCICMGEEEHYEFRKKEK